MKGWNIGQMDKVLRVTKRSTSGTICTPTNTQNHVANEGVLVITTIIMYNASLMLVFLRFVFLFCFTFLCLLRITQMIEARLTMIEIINVT